MVGWTIVWVSERSFRAIIFWYSTMFSAPCSLPIGGPLCGTAGEAREGHVDVVGAPPHEADGGLGVDLEPPPPALDVLLGARDQVAHVDRLAGLGVGKEAFFGPVVLQVEEASHRVGRPFEFGVQGGVLHPFTPQPEFAAVLQPLEKLFSCTCAHDPILLILGSLHAGPRGRARRRARQACR